MWEGKSKDWTGGPTPTSRACDLMFRQWRGGGSPLLYKGRNEPLVTLLVQGSSGIRNLKTEVLNYNQTKEGGPSRAVLWESLLSSVLAMSDELGFVLSGGSEKFNGKHQPHLRLKCRWVPDATPLHLEATEGSWSFCADGIP